MWRALYTFLYLLLLPFALLRQHLRGIREPGYRVDPHGRFGHVVGVPPGGIWIHAVSAGETIAAVPLVRALQTMHPNAPLLLTVSTASGRERARKLLGDDVQLRWLPWDLPWTMRRFLRATAPSVLVIFETELWPSLLHEAKRAGVTTLLVNGRLSARSAAGYGRIGGLTRQMLGALDVIACQDADTASRMLRLGADPVRVVVTGSIKFDLDMPPDIAERIEAARALAGAGASRILVAASTHDNEEARILMALRPLLMAHPDWRLVLVPRHPDRFDAVWALCSNSGLRAARWTNGPAPADTQVVLGDVMGELLAIYGIADVAFVGGSLVERGGHNPIEPAAHGVPVLTGPHTVNFETIMGTFLEARAVTVVVGARALAEQTEELFTSDAERARRGAAARDVVTKERGALDGIAGLASDCFTLHAVGKVLDMTRVPDATRGLTGAGTIGFSGAGVDVGAVAALPDSGSGAEERSGGSSTGGG